MVCRTIVLLAFATQAWACVCSFDLTSVKKAWQDAPFVFVGTVELADPDLPADQAEFKRQLVRVRVDEAFKGLGKGQVIELHQGASDCDAKFRTGERFVFYLNVGEDPTEFAVLACTHALGNAESGSDDLLFLHGLPDSAIGTRLSGEVAIYEDRPEEFHRVGGVPNMPVRITAPGQPPHQAVTNGAGAWEVYGLSPGDYSVHIDVPSGFTPLLDSDSTAKLERDGGASIDFFLVADTRLSGRVLDDTGAPRKDVCLDLKPLEGPGRGGFDCSDESGHFEMTQVPAGRYRLVAQDEIGTPPSKSQSSTLYYPGVRDLNQAGVITIEAGKHVEGLDVRIPTGEVRSQLSGKVQYSDGAPVAKAQVTFTSPEHGYTETTKTGEDGSFHLSVLAGMPGQLRGAASILGFDLTQCPQFRVDSLVSNSISLSPDTDRDTLQLTIPSPPCPARPPRTN